MVTDSTASVGEKNIYTRIGVTQIINASGATTTVGGTLMVPEALDAMVEASRSFVVISELNERVGEAIARATGAEAGYPTAGSASAMALAVAACLTGTDRALAKRLPDTRGMANELIIHRAHHIGYEQMFRSPGATFVEIGGLNKTEPWELEAAISERTAAILYVDSFSVVDGALDFDSVVDIAHRHDKPVIVDAASSLPPAGHLTRWISAGADLVIYSGGKGIRGPQNSGLLAGRKDLIEAAAMHGTPNAGIGRGMKTSKETLAGLYAALEWFMYHDHAREYQERVEQARGIQTELEKRDDTYCSLLTDQGVYPAPILSVFPVERAWSPQSLRAALIAGQPPIHCKPPHKGLDINMHCLTIEESVIVTERFQAELNRLTGQDGV